MIDYINKLQSTGKTDVLKLILLTNPLSFHLLDNADSELRKWIIGKHPNMLSQFNDITDDELKKAIETDPLHVAMVYSNRLKRDMWRLIIDAEPSAIKYKKHHTYTDCDRAIRSDVNAIFFCSNLTPADKLKLVNTYYKKDPSILKSLYVITNMKLDDMVTTRKIAEYVKACPTLIYILQAYQSRHYDDGILRMALDLKPELLLDIDLKLYNVSDDLMFDILYNNPDMITLNGVKDLSQAMLSRLVAVSPDVIKLVLDPSIDVIKEALISDITLVKYIEPLSNDSIVYVNEIKKALDGKIKTI